MDLMVSMFLMPVVVTPCSRASVTSEPRAFFLMDLAVRRITASSESMERMTTRPSFQLYIMSSQAQRTGRTTSTRAKERWSMVVPIFLMPE